MLGLFNNTGNTSKIPSEGGQALASGASNLESADVDNGLRSEHGISGIRDGLSFKNIADLTSLDSEAKNNMVNAEKVEQNEVGEKYLDLGWVTDETELAANVSDKLAKVMREDDFLGKSNTIEIIQENKIKDFKSGMRERLSRMGVDKYKDGAAKVGQFIKNICIDYYKNTTKVLKFGLVVKQEKEHDTKTILLKADDFIESVNLDNVVARVNDKNKESGKGTEINLSEYLEVVDMNAVEAMELLKGMRTSLTPDVSRWFGAVQRIVGMPKDGEPFKNYLQRAMSMKSEIDGNLNHPEQENIENALREVVPMLRKESAKERMSKKARSAERYNLKHEGARNKQTIDVASGQSVEKDEGNQSVLSFGEKMMLKIEQETDGSIDINDYNVVSRLDAKQSMIVLERIAENAGATEMARLISRSIQTDKQNIDNKTFGEYIDGNVSLEQLKLLQDNIKNDLSEFGDDISADDVLARDAFALLVENKEKLTHTKKGMMAQLFRMGGVAAPVRDETLNAYFNRLENRVNNLHYFLKYAVPNLRRAMNRTVYNKR